MERGLRQTVYIETRKLENWKTGKTGAQTHTIITSSSSLSPSLSLSSPSHHLLPPLSTSLSSENTPYIRDLGWARMQNIVLLLLVPKCSSDFFYPSVQACIGPVFTRTRRHDMRVWSGNLNDTLRHQQACGSGGRAGRPATRRVGGPTPGSSSVPGLNTEPQAPPSMYHRCV